MAADGGASSFPSGVCLNPLDCNLDTIISSDRLSAHTLSVGACGYCWSGVRANLGIFARGKYFFRVTVGLPRPVNVHNTSALTTAAAIRVGVSRFQTSVQQLGEAPYSWAFCNTGTRVCCPAAAANATPTPSNPVFEAHFGPKLSPGDTVTIALDLTTPSPGGRREAAEGLSRAPDGTAQGTAAVGPAAAAGASTTATSAAADNADNSSGNSNSSGGGEEQGTLWMAVNGGELMPLFSVPLPNNPLHSLFPHILIRNLSATADFTGKQPSEREQQQKGQQQQQQQQQQGPWIREPQAQRHQPLPPGLLERGFRPWQEAMVLTADCVSTMPANQLPKPSTCEVIVLTGLPGSGKTTWAASHCQQNQSRRYCVLGTNLVLEQMRLCCPNTRRFHYIGKPEEVFALVGDVLARNLRRAPLFPQNYIIDRTHVTADARRDVVAPFKSVGFRCVSVAVVVTEADLYKNQKQAFEREGKMVPDEAMARLRASFTLPSQEEGFDEVRYPVLGLIGSLKTVKQQRGDAWRWLAWKLQVEPGAAGAQRSPRQEQKQEQQQRPQVSEAGKGQQLERDSQEMADGAAAGSPRDASVTEGNSSVAGCANETSAPGAVDGGGQGAGGTGRGEVRKRNREESPLLEFPPLPTDSPPPQPDCNAESGLPPQPPQLLQPEVLKQCHMGSQAALSQPFQPQEQQQALPQHQQQAVLQQPPYQHQQQPPFQQQQLFLQQQQQPFPHLGLGPGPPLPPQFSNNGSCAGAGMNFMALQQAQSQQPFQPQFVGPILCPCPGRGEPGGNTLRQSASGVPGSMQPPLGLHPVQMHAMRGNVLGMGMPGTGMALSMSGVGVAGNGAMMGPGCINPMAGGFSTRGLGGMDSMARGGPMMGSGAMNSEGLGMMQVMQRMQSSQPSTMAL